MTSITKTKFKNANEAYEYLLDAAIVKGVKFDDIEKRNQAMPTPEEMLLGLYQWLSDQLQNQLNNIGSNNEKKIALRN